MKKSDEDDDFEHGLGCLGAIALIVLIWLCPSKADHEKAIRNGIDEKISTISQTGESRMLQRIALAAFGDAIKMDDFSSFIVFSYGRWGTVRTVGVLSKVFVF